MLAAVAAARVAGRPVLIFLTGWSGTGRTSALTELGRHLENPWHVGAPDVGTAPSASGDELVQAAELGRSLLLDDADAFMSPPRVLSAVWAAVAGASGVLVVATSYRTFAEHLVGAKPDHWAHLGGDTELPAPYASLSR